MKISQLENFVAVVDYGSINQAAEKLYVTQPSLSRSIRSLEQEMGKDLLIRTNHGVSMTPTGRLLYYYGQSILKELRVLERLKGLEEKTIYSKLSVSIDSIFLKDDLILLCYKKLLSSETEIQMMETSAEGVMEDIADSKSEIGITILNDVQLPVFKKMAEIKNMEVSVLDSGPVYIHIRENHPLANADTVNFRDLLDCTYIRLPNNFFSNLNHSIMLDGIQYSSFPKSLIMSNYHAMLNIAKRTDAFMIGHKWQIAELKHSHIKSLLLNNSTINMNFVLVKRKNDILSDAGNIFIDIIKKTYV